MNLFSRFKKRIYLDYAAAAPMAAAVERAMRPYTREIFANASAIHTEGVKARQAVEEARSLIAKTLGVRSEGVLFTSSGTESNNLAILGTIKRIARKEGVPYGEIEVITTKLEHPSILALIPVLQTTGVVTKYIPVDKVGLVTVSGLQSVLSARTRLVTLAYANSEIGVIQKIGRLVREIRKAEEKYGHKIIVHLDAAQAPLWLPCQLSPIGVDLMTLDAGKCEGPKGVGILVSRTAFALVPLLYGGGQEGGLRPSTENVSGIVGAAKAIELAQSFYPERAKTVAVVRDAFLAELALVLPEVVVNGPRGEARLANNINISLPGLDTEYAVVYLDKYGVSASTKSACAGAGGGESLVVREISGDSMLARSTLRLTLSPKTTRADLSYTLKILRQFSKLMSQSDVTRSDNS